MENMTPFDVVVFLVLLGFFILGYVQGIARRLLGILALIFALVAAAQLREPLGNYLAHEWTSAPPEYSYMVAFGSLFFAIWVALSVGIQWFYRAAPLLPSYPVVDEILGGLLGVLEGAILLVVLLLVTDPYFRTTAGQVAAPGEFQPFRAAHDLVTDSLTADYLRHTVIPNLLAFFGFLFPQDVVATFASAVRSRLT